MTRDAVTSDQLPPSRLPFSVAVRGGGLLFLSGQVAQDPATGELVDGDVAQQADQILRNIAATLAAIGKDLDDVIRVGVYLTDMSQCLVRARVIENRRPVVAANRTTSAAWIASLTGAALARPPSVPASAAASASSPAASTTCSPPAVKCRATALPMFPAPMIAVVIGCLLFVAGPGKWLAWSLRPGELPAYPW